MLGVVLWVAARTATFALQREGDENVFGHPLTAALFIVGLLLMVGGPVVFWWVLPAWSRRGPDK